MAVPRAVDSSPQKVWLQHVCSEGISASPCFSFPHGRNRTVVNHLYEAAALFGIVVYETVPRQLGVVLFSEKESRAS